MSAVQVRQGASWPVPWPRFGPSLEYAAHHRIAGLPDATFSLTPELMTAILSASGRVYTGICVDTQCSVGFCAEHAAVAEMLKARESEIALGVAVASGGKILLSVGAAAS